MRVNKLLKTNKLELLFFLFVYMFLFLNAFIMNDSILALMSAFCGITYTILAGKGYPICYPIGLLGSGIYAYLSFLSHLWGNCVLYLCYYIPMQIIGFFKWNSNLKPDSDEKHSVSLTKEIIKINLNNRQRWLYFSIASVISFVLVFLLKYYGDKYPVIDSVTTVFSILGMYLTVRRAIEQWIAWMLVNLLSFIMWLNIALSGEKVYSTVVMWLVYLILAIYFYINWHKEIKKTIK